MMFGRYGEGKQTLPRVIHISIARYQRVLPRPGRPLQYLVTIHEEGTGISWQRNVEVGPEIEKYFLQTTDDLYLWSRNLALTPGEALKRVRHLGERLYETFIGKQGEQYLQGVKPTAVLLDVDETTLNLPWELIADQAGTISQSTPFGRVVTTRLIPRPGRDPLQEDAEVRLLAVVNPTSDLSASAAEMQALEQVSQSLQLKIDVLERAQATLAGFKEAISKGDYDILHFAGHAFLDPKKPGLSAIHLSDGVITADEIGGLPWKAPPYLVFNSSCESGRAAGGKRLVSASNHSNGLAAAFLAAGVDAYAGYFWPVTDTGAELFAGQFYRALFSRENVGLAFLAARNSAISELGDTGDLTGYSAVLFGDAASEHRRDLAMAV